MLLLRWHETLERFRDRPAILDGGSVLTFGDINDALAATSTASGPVIAQGPALNVAVATLRGWRDSQPVLPLEKPGNPTLDAVPENVAHLKLTPGNEGQPRTVRFTAEQIAADADRLVQAMELSPDIPNLATVSLSHSYGYSSIILPLLLHGVPLRSVEVPFPAVVAKAWKDHERIVVPAVPSMWRAWLRSGILENAPITLAISAGAPLALDLEQSIWESRRLKLHNFYGASECGGISYDTSDRPRENTDDLGTPLPGVEVGIQPGGRILVSSSAVAMGYDHPRSSELLGDGRFLTPDHGHLDGDHLLLDSRSGDMINVAGRKLGPARIESILLAAGLVRKARVFGIPSTDPERVDEVAALIESEHDAELIARSVGDELAGWEIPRHWITNADPEDWHLSRQELRAKHRC